MKFYEKKLLEASCKLLQTAFSFLRILAKYEWIFRGQQKPNS